MRPLNAIAPATGVTVDNVASHIAQLHPADKLRLAAALLTNDGPEFLRLAQSVTARALDDLAWLRRADSVGAKLT